ncbi:MAG TPA: glycerate kinase [Solirubrobacteraceae bacterium]|nr:glycerate kinase [Solirubrobacteraceae bacterium]
MPRLPASLVPAIPRTLLIAARLFGVRLDAERVCSALAAGLREGGWQVDECPLDGERESELARSLVRSPQFDARVRAARAIVIAEPRLHEDTLAGSVAFEIATHARQTGVPAYAVTGENLLDSFDARILDLQTILQARTHRSLRTAGRKLASLV